MILRVREESKMHVCGFESVRLLLEYLIYAYDILNVAKKTSQYPDQRVREAKPLVSIVASSQTYLEIDGLF